jgi:hypothetical protein
MLWPLEDPPFGSEALPFFVFTPSGSEALLFFVHTLNRKLQTVSQKPSGTPSDTVVESGEAAARGFADRGPEAASTAQSASTAIQRREGRIMEVSCSGGGSGAAVMAVRAPLS